MVKNEADIIETFIRYHVSILDGMIILDNGSNDNTVKIVNELIAEGLPVHLIFDDNPSYDQSSITTNMLYSTLRQFKADYILPLDADEFLIKKNAQDIRVTLKKQLNQNTIFFLSWITYIPTAHDDKKELNLLKRITHRRKIQHNYDKKIIIPADIAKQHKITIRQGNHEIDGSSAKKFKRVDLKNLALAHFPIRSASQAKSKYLVGWLANLARDKQVLFDWYYYYNILKDGKKLTPDDLRNMALRYDVPNKRINMTVVKDPIKLSKEQSFKLKYTEKTETAYLQNLLSYTETLAKKYSNLVKLNKGNKDYRTISNSYNDQIILQLIKNYSLIHGWFSANEALALFKLVQSIKRDNVVVCEIGSWLGKSSYVIARALDTKKYGKLFCIDPFDSSGEDSSKRLYKHLAQNLKMSILDKFKENMIKFGVMNKIEIIQGHSQDVIKTFNTKIDILFIDGDHSYKAVLNDYKNWSKLVKKGGYIVFHDVGAAHTTGPKEVVELEIAKNSQWDNHLLIDELFIARKTK